MEREDRTTPLMCRWELLQAAFEGATWPTLSVEHLLDRLTDPPARDRDLARALTRTEGTSR